MDKNIGKTSLETALQLLESFLSSSGTEQFQLVVCGGSALIAMNFVERTTKDVDVLARMDSNGGLIDPDPIPTALLSAVEQVAVTLSLPKNWLNNGPADLFRMGLPNGFQDRLHAVSYGDSLRVYYIGRLDQIHFKLYASVDRGGYHMADLLELDPTSDELYQAAIWSMTHDASEGYRHVLQQFLHHIDFHDVADKL